MASTPEFVLKARALEQHANNRYTCTMHAACMYMLHVMWQHLEHAEDIDNERPAFPVQHILQHLQALLSRA